MRDSSSLSYFDKSNNQEVLNRFDSINSVSQIFVQHLSEIYYDAKSYNADDFEQFTLNEILSYLQASHRYYLNVWLPKINQSVQQLLAASGESSLVIKPLFLFVVKYQQELENHIEKEEKILFSFVDDLLKGEYSSERKNFVINHFLFTHNDNVIVQLDELKADLVRFEKELEQNLNFHILFNQLEIFQNDLLIHGLIEDDVFVPKVLRLINQDFEELGLSSR